MMNNNEDRIKLFDEIVDRGHSLGLKKFIFPNYIGRLRGNQEKQKLEIDSFITISNDGICRIETGDSDERQRELIGREADLTVTFTSNERDYNIIFCCSLNDRDEYYIQAFSDDSPLQPFPVDVSLVNTGSLVPVSWGTVSARNRKSISLKIYSNMSRFPFLFAMFGSEFKSTSRNERSDLEEMCDWMRSYE